MAILNAKEFVERTTFISEYEEDALKQQYKTFSAVVNAAGTDNGEEWVAASLMLDSDYEELVNLMDDEGMIDTDDLRKSKIPSFITRNNHSRGITNIQPEDFKLLRPGIPVKLLVTLNEDDEGNRYLNGSVIEVELNEGATVNRSVDSVGSTKSKPVEAA